MIVCPNCKAEIEADSKFCDQCGKELMYCPVCGEPKRGTECPRCAEDLIPARVFLARKEKQGNQDLNQVKPGNTVNKDIPVKDVEMPQPRKQPVHSPSPIPEQTDSPQGTVVFQSALPALSIVGNAWSLPLKEGRFGRTGGIFREFSTVQYISGNHGAFRIHGAEWQVQDVGSTNGTFLNGKKLLPGQWYGVKKGDTLKIATITFEIR